MSNIYLLEWQENEPNTDQTNWFRIGYYGICFLGGKSINTCVGTSGKSADKIWSDLFGTSDGDTDAQIAIYLQRNAFVAFMTAAGIAWLISLFLATMIALTAGKAGRSWCFTAKLFASVSAILMVSASWATSSAIAAIEAFTKFGAANTAKLTGGTTLVALQWLAAILTCFYTWAVYHLCNDQEPKADTYSYNMGR